MQDGPESCKHLTQCMLDGPNTETSEMDYTIGMQAILKWPNQPQTVPMQAKIVANMD